MSRAGLTFSHIDRLAVTVGPGTFTGTRIGVAAARALALSSGKEVVGASSLAVMAEAALRELLPPPGTDLAVAVDARRGQAYVQLFAASALKPKSPPLLLSIEEAGRIGAGALIVVGSAAEAVAAAAAASGRRMVGTSARFAARRRGVGAHGLRASRQPRSPGAALSSAARCQAPGREIDCEGPAVKPATLIPLDPRNLSLLWASPERVPDIAELHARLFDPAWDAASIGRLDRASGRRGVHRPDTRAQGACRLRHRSDRGGPGRDPLGWSGTRVAAPRDRAPDGRGSRSARLVAPRSSACSWRWRPTTPQP